MPQKQPPATTAVCWPETAVSLASCAGAGTAAAAPALALQAVAPTSNPRKIKVDLSEAPGMLLSPCPRTGGKSLVDWSCGERKSFKVTTISRGPVRSPFDCAQGGLRYTN